MSGDRRGGRDRREILRAGLGILLFGLAPGCGPSVRDPAAERARLRELARGLGPEARKVGTAWLDGGGGEADAERLGDLLLEVAAGDGNLPDRLAGAVRADYEAGRTVDVDGWYLAVTEVRLAALAAVLARG